jgi:prephenate dehydrogenase
MQTAAIFGIGLIGGSFALAIRRAGFTGPVLGVSSPSTIAKALKKNVISEGVSLEEACARADFIYLAQPIQRILDVIPLLAEHVREDALITDAGSTKSAIMEAADRHIKRGYFLGGHPMAGREVRGVEAAEAELFQDRPYVLTPRHLSDLEIPMVGEFMNLIRAIGAHPVTLTSDEHDRAVAYLSHLPQILSTALASTLHDLDLRMEIAGPGVLDLTRLALSPFDIWRDIFVTNQSNIAGAIDDFICKLQYLKRNLDSEQARKVFSEAAGAARRLRKN